MTRGYRSVIVILLGGTLVSASAMAMPDPASVFCGKMHGRSVNATLASGDEIGLCYLDEHSIVEEWTLFRMFKGRVPPARGNPFRHR